MFSVEVENFLVTQLHIRIVVMDQQEFIGLFQQTVSARKDDFSTTLRAGFEKYPVIRFRSILFINVLSHIVTFNVGNSIRATLPNVTFLFCGFFRVF